MVFACVGRRREGLVCVVRERRSMVVREHRPCVQRNYDVKISAALVVCAASVTLKKRFVPSTPVKARNITGVVRIFP